MLCLPLASRQARTPGEAAPFRCAFQFSRCWVLGAAVLVLPSRRFPGCEVRVCRGRPHPRGWLPFPSTSLRSRLSGGGIWVGRSMLRASGPPPLAHCGATRYSAGTSATGPHLTGSHTSRHCRDWVSRVFQSPTSSANHPTLFWMRPNTPELGRSRQRYACSTCSMYMTLALRFSGSALLLDSSRHRRCGNPDCHPPIRRRSIVGRWRWRWYG